MQSKLIILGVILALIVGFSGWIIGGYNNIQRLDEDINSKWAQVENQLQRRYDLIPNLVATVKGYAKHEEGVFKDVADARAKMGSVIQNSDNPKAAAAAQASMSGALSRLLVVAENYPQLKADAQFTQLMDELAGTENRLAVARKDYNDEVNIYNAEIRVFPTNLLAGVFGAAKREYFNPPEEATKSVKVDFGTE